MTAITAAAEISVAAVAMRTMEKKRVPLKQLEVFSFRFVSLSSFDLNNFMISPSLKG